MIIKKKNDKIADQELPRSEYFWISLQFLHFTRSYNATPVVLLSANHMETRHQSSTESQHGLR